MLCHERNGLVSAPPPSHASYRVRPFRRVRHPPLEMLPPLTYVRVQPLLVTTMSLGVRSNSIAPRAGANLALNGVLVVGRVELISKIVGVEFQRTNNSGGEIIILIWYIHVLLREINIATIERVARRHPNSAHPTQGRGGGEEYW